MVGTDSPLLVGRSRRTPDSPQQRSQSKFPAAAGQEADKTVAKLRRELEEGRESDISQCTTAIRVQPRKHIAAIRGKNKKTKFNISLKCSGYKVKV